MDAAEKFESRLYQLDPESAEFILQVDEIVESVPPEQHEDLIPAIFRFFEKHPLADCGAPGALIHLTEKFYPSYKTILLQSVASAPSYNGILMTNRILNSKLLSDDRNEYLTVLRNLSVRTDIHESLVKAAQDFLEFQRRKKTN